ncbi:MAG: spondin domain-containing protein [Phycisphaerales bacterium]|nr:spondin domain-containing protein [Phycisphaerales bacterium]
MRMILGTAIALAASAGIASAQPVQLQVTVENLSSSNGTALSPFTVGFHDGTFDAFDAGTAAGAGIQAVAESGDGTQYLADFMAQQPSGVSGTIIATTGGFGPGIFLPGGSGSMTFVVDPSVNRFFSFGSMVVPSNDRFLGNDGGMDVELFDAGGNFVGQDLMLMGSDIWDAGSEMDGTFGAAFIVGSDAGDHIAQGGVVGHSSDFSVYSGAMTPAGYDFVDLPMDGGAVARISFAVVPAPGAVALLGIAGLGVRRRRRA